MASRLATALHERFVAWALRVRPPEAAPIVLVQRRVYVLPTRPGLAFAGALMVMLVGAINYNLSLGYVLTFLLAGLGVATILNTFRNLAGLRLSPGRCDAVFAGQIARFGVIVENRRAAPRRSVVVNLPGAAGLSIDVPHESAAEVSLPWPAPRRGWLPLPRLTIATTFPLGLVRAWSYAVPDQRCLVYPAPAATAPPLPAAAGGRYGRGREGRGEEDFGGLRTYQPGDSPRRIAWKTVARQGGPLVTKEFVGDAGERLLFDWSGLPALGVEERLSVLARWICLAHARGSSWGLRLPGVELPMGAGDAHYHASLKALALHGQAG